MFKDLEALAIIKTFSQIIMTIAAAVCICFVFFDKSYESSPAWLAIISLGVAILYVCFIGFEKVSNVNLYRHTFKVIPDKAYIKIVQFTYIIIFGVTFFLMIISSVKVNSLPGEVTDAMGIITLVLTLCVELITTLVAYLLSLKFTNINIK